MTPGSLAGKTALVTGASRGLGREIARALAAAGASLALIARDKDLLESVADEIRGNSTVTQNCGGLPTPPLPVPRERNGVRVPFEQERSATSEDPHPNPLPAYRERGQESGFPRSSVTPGSSRVCTYPADLSELAAIEDVVERAASDLGPIDILVNNAGVQGPIGLFEKVNFAQWRETFQINLFAPARLCQLLLPAMRKRGWGKIVNLSGGGATSPRPNFTAYGASKCALVRLTETLARELTGSGIDVNAVAPGPMNTRMLEEVIAAGPKAAAPEYESAVKRSREGGVSPKVAAELVLFLASAASDGISGRLISAVYDDWKSLASQRDALAGGDRFTLRRVT